MEYLFLKTKNASTNINYHGYILRSIAMIRVDEEFNILSHKVYNFNPNIENWDKYIELKDKFNDYPLFKDCIKEIKEELLKSKTIILNDNPYFLKHSFNDTCTYNEIDKIEFDCVDTLELRLAYPNESLAYKEELSIDLALSEDINDYDKELLNNLKEELLRMKLLVIMKNKDLSKIIKSYLDLKKIREQELAKLKELAEINGQESFEKE